MNEQHFGHKVRQHLNRGAHDLRPDTLDRLAAARAIALTHQKHVVTSPVLAAVGNLLSLDTFGSRLSQVLVGLALLLCASYSTYWVADQQVKELGDIDSAILSDELPIGAFTDKGFAAWLRSTSSE